MVILINSYDNLWTDYGHYNAKVYKDFNMVLNGI